MNANSSVWRSASRGGRRAARRHEMETLAYFANVTARSFCLAAAALAAVLLFQVKTAAARHSVMTVVAAGYDVAGRPHARTAAPPCARASRRARGRSIPYPDLHDGTSRAAGTVFGRSDAGLKHVPMATAHRMADGRRDSLLCRYRGSSPAPDLRLSVRAPLGGRQPPRRLGGTDGAPG